MNRGIALALIILAIMLYLLGAYTLAQYLGFSIYGLWFTLSNMALLGDLVAHSVGAFTPALIVHYMAYRVLRATKIVRQRPKLATPSTASAVIQQGQQNVVRPTTAAADGTRSTGDTVPKLSSQISVQLTPPSAPQATVMTRPEKQVSATPAEEFWAAALVEVESGSCRPGLWARAYSEAQGDDALAKATYLDRRARQLESEHVLSVERRAREAREEADELERKRLTDAHKADALSPKGLCPNCQSLIPRECPVCPNCKAIFTQPGGWRPVPTDCTTQTVVAEVVLTPEVSTSLLTAHGCRVTRLNDTSWEILEPNGLSSFARSSDDLQRVARLYAVKRDEASVKA